MRTSRSNIVILRVGDIGSMSAWLPSRRSVDSQRGASVITACGHVRSGRSIGGKARDRWNGIGEGAWWFAVRLLVMVSLRGWRREVCVRRPVGGPGAQPDPAARRSGSGLAAAAKEEALPRLARHEASTIADPPTGHPGDPSAAGVTARTGISTSSATITTVTASTPMKTLCTPSASSEDVGWLPTVALTTAPKTATPTAEPNDLANMFVPVTAPRSPQATLDWATTSAGAATHPMPSPISRHPAATDHTDPVPLTNTSTAAP